MKKRKTKLTLDDVLGPRQRVAELTDDELAELDFEEVPALKRGRPKEPAA